LWIEIWGDGKSQITSTGSIAQSTENSRVSVKILRVYRLPNQTGRKMGAEKSFDLCNWFCTKMPRASARSSLLPT
jgi:hypothetical protein